MKQIVSGFALLATMLVVPADVHGQARTVRMPGPYGATRVFAILLPRSYETSNARYPVVYLFHGGGQDHTAFMARTAFAPMSRRHEFIVVMPAVDRSYSAIGPDAQGGYHDYVAGDLVDYVDSHYRTIPNRENRAIAGLSMGGRVATMTALAHADRFGTVGAFSPALRPDVEAAVRTVSAPAPYFFVSCGTEDALLSINREFVGWLTARHVAHEYFEAPGVGHSWILWDPQIASFFDLLDRRGLKPAAP